MVQFILTPEDLASSPVYVESFDCSNGLIAVMTAVNGTNVPYTVQLQASATGNFESDAVDIGMSMEVIDGGAAKIVKSLAASHVYVRVKVNLLDGAPSTGTLELNMTQKLKPAPVI